MDWRLLVAKKAILGRVPFAETLRRAKRRSFGYTPDLGNLETTLENYAQIVLAATAQGRPIEGARVLEIGTGWFPLIPILLCVDGAREVVMTDLSRHLDEVTFASAIAFLKQRFPGRAALNRIHCMADLPLRYLAPFSPQDLADGSIDLVVSRTVLEHIDPGALRLLMAALRPKLAPLGLMVHLVDHSDHLQHQDRSISAINFLGWSDRLHRTVNWLIREGENRLRHHDYPPLFAQAGFELVAEQCEVHDDTLARLPHVKLTSPWSDMSFHHLAILVSVYVFRAASELSTQR